MTAVHNRLLLQLALQLAFQHRRLRHRGLPQVHRLLHQLPRLLLPMLHQRVGLPPVPFTISSNTTDSSYRDTWSPWPETWPETWPQALEFACAVQQEHQRMIFVT